jgi:hypothetical protein
MCDYSLQAVKTRKAEVGDKLVTKNFGTGTTGFTLQGAGEPVAVCLLPGTELGFEQRVHYTEDGDIAAGPKTAIFRQIHKDFLYTHHDALEFPDGKQVKLTLMLPYQNATVLQLPAAPKTKEEAEAQQRMAYAG